MEAGKGLEIIVGLPSFMESDSIAHVTRQVDLGLQRHFPGMKSVIVNVDNHSEDDTRGAFLSAGTATLKKYISTKQFVRGKGNNFMNLFRFARKHLSTLRALAVFDTDLRSIEPEWVKLTIGAVLEGYDFAVPKYSRHQFDGTITNHICYPLLHGLLGEDIRQPIGGEFALSPSMVSHLLKVPWPPEARLYGVDIFMTMSAVLSDFRICEVGLGVKIHKASAPKIGPMFTQVVTTLFSQLLAHRERWLETPEAEPGAKPLFGKTKLERPQEMSIDLRTLKERARTEFSAADAVVRKYLGRYLAGVVRRMVEEDSYRLGVQLWAQVVYRFLHAYGNGSAKEKRALIEALKPLHLVRTISFDYESEKRRIEFAEDLIHEQAMAFASMKPFLDGLFAGTGNTRLRAPQKTR